MGIVTMLTGGARSGKSRMALELAKDYEKRYFIATAEPTDQEMILRIEKHKAERKKDYITIEEPIYLANAITLHEHHADIIVVDCITVWIGNLLISCDRKTADEEIDSLIHTVESDLQCDLIIVTNEVGSGIVPDNELGRTFRDLIGKVNQQLAHAARNVVLMISGIPVHVKPQN